MQKSLACSVVSLLIGLLLALAAAALAGTGVPNGGFETVNEQGQPAQWSLLAPEGVGRIVLSDEAHSGAHSLLLERLNPYKKGIVGVNSAAKGSGEQGAMLSQLKGVISFWYKLVSGPPENIHFNIIPMSAKALEDTGEPRVRFEAPPDAADGQWHFVTLKYDYSDCPKVKYVLIAPRVVGEKGAYLLDDIHYYAPEQTQGLPEITSLRLVENPLLPGLEATLEVKVKNLGFGTLAGAIAEFESSGGLGLMPAKVAVPTLQKDEEAVLKATLRGLRDKPGKVEVQLTGTPFPMKRVLAFAPELEVQDFRLDHLLLAKSQRAWLTVRIANTGHSMLSGLSVKLKAPKCVKAHYITGKTSLLKPGESTTLRWLVSAKKAALWSKFELQVKGDKVEDVELSAPVVVEDEAWGGGEGTGVIQLAAGVALATEAVRCSFAKSKAGYSPAVLYLHKPVKVGRLWTQVAVLPYLARLVVEGAKGPETYFPWFQLAGTGRDRLEFATEVKDSAGHIWTLKVTLATSAFEDTLKLTHELSCDGPGELLAFDGPVVYAGSGTFGAQKKQAVFPGLEWLVDDEVSSSDLDIEPDHPDRIRYVPHPNAITCPWMAVTNQEGTVGLLWDCYQRWDGKHDRPAAAFASPDYFNHVDGHLMALFLPSVPDWVPRNQRVASKPYLLKAGGQLKLESYLFVSPQTKSPLVAQTRWFDLFEVPKPLPPAAGPWPEEVQFSMNAYLKSLWVPEEKTWWTSKGNSFSSAKARPPSYLYWLRYGALVAPDPAIREAASRIESEVEALLNRPPSEVDAGFTWGDPPALLQSMVINATGAYNLQDKRGAWTYNGNRQGSGPFKGYDYNQLGKTGSDALGLNTQNLLSLLKVIKFTGDYTLMPAAERTLNFLKRFRVPRAAQVWEVPVHTPDILAAGQACQDYVLAYELTGKAEYLQEARRWAEAGLPFIYTWNTPEFKFLRYASIPVFGASLFNCSWFARPVQWNGLSYAEALLDLSKYDDSFPWRQVAEGIYVSATYQQEHEDPDNLALWPDSIRAITGEKAGWIFAPDQILRLGSGLFDQPLQPSLYKLSTPDGPLHLLVRGKVTAHLDADGTLKAEVTFPSVTAGWLVLTPVSAPKQVLLNGRALDYRPYADGAPAAGDYWTRFTSYGLLMVHFEKPGTYKLEIQGVRRAKREVLPEKRTTLDFEFHNSTEGWLPKQSVGDVRAENDCLVFKVLGGDPYLGRANVQIPGSSVEKIVIRLKITSKPPQTGEFYWGTATQPSPSESRVVRFELKVDGAFHTYVLDMSKVSQWKDQTITFLRLDPGNKGPAEVAVDYIRGEP